MRSVARALFRLLMKPGAIERRDEDLARPAVVFAPHPDDETLGCGGTILRKRQLGADVSIVIVTDGSASHAHLMPPAELRALRAGEAAAAAHALNVEANHLHLLGFQDGKLSENETPAVQKVVELLQELSPGEVYIPYFQDGPSDHHATTRVVLAALREARSRPDVYEYPIWYWHHWPWVKVGGGKRARLRGMRDGLAASWNLARDCRFYVRIGDFVDRKRKALDQHRSQMQRLVNDRAWLTLGDASDGDWLACFFGDREVFFKHPPAPPS